MGVKLEQLFEFHPIENALISDNNNIVYMNRYWFMYNGTVLRHKLSKAWQGNKSKQVLELLKSSSELYKDLEIVYYPYLYLPE